MWLLYPSVEWLGDLRRWHSDRLVVFSAQVVARP